METSLISSRTLNEMQKEQTRQMNETQLFEVKSMPSKRKGENTEQKLRES